MLWRNNMSNDEVTKKLNLTPTKKPNPVVRRSDSQEPRVTMEPKTAAPKPEKVVEKPTPKEPTKADLMWDQLKSVDLNMFGIPNQTIEKYCQPIPANPNELTLKMREAKKNATGVVSVMSQVLAPKYEVDLNDRYIVVREVKV